MKIVKLFMGWVWRCPECGHRNAHGGEVEDDPEILAEARAALEVPEGEEGVLVTAPTHVFCAKCEERFESDPQ
jgi:hypothetical protein